MEIRAPSQDRALPQLDARAAAGRGAVEAAGARERLGLFGFLGHAMKNRARRILSRLYVELLCRGEKFSPEEYLAQYPDVAAAGVDPYVHYVRHGRRERRGGAVRGAPPAFASLTRVGTAVGELRQAYGDALRKHLRPLASRVQLRAWRRGPDFSPEFYLEQYPDVAASGVDPYEHYLRHGRAEGRLGKMPALPELDAAAHREALDPRRETVLVVSHTGSRTGAPVLSYNLVKHLLRKYNVVALFLGPGPVLDECRAAGAAVIGPVALHGSAIVSEHVVKRIADAVPIRFALINSIESRWLLEPLARRHVPTVTLVHEFAAYTRPRDAFRETVLWSGQTVFSSRITRDNAVESYPELAAGEYPVLPQGRCALPRGDGPGPEERADEVSRIESVMRPAGFPAEGLVVLGAGFIHLRKGVDLFVECAARVLRQAGDTPVRFVWVGKGYDPDNDVAYSVYLADQIRRAGLENDVRFMDEVADLERVYALSDLLLLSSRLDPLPNVAIDALARGLPVVCFDRTTGIAEILKEQGLGEDCVAAYLDTEAMARKVLALAQSRECRARVGERSARIIGTTFDMEGYVGRLEQLALREVERSRQEKRDLDTIRESGLLRLDFFFRARERHPNPEQALRRYVRSWASGVGRRKLFPGFHPGIYREQHGVNPGVDPLADYLRAGRPGGPWRFDLITSSEKPKPLPAGLRVALHVHAYYPDLFPELMRRLERNRVRPDLLISVPDEAARLAVEAEVRGYGGGTVAVLVVPNRGRDIGALLTGFGDIARRYDLVGHLHTKKTADVKDASMARNWSQFLLDNLLASPVPMADIILGRMADDASIGMVFPDDPHVCGWDKNLPFVEGLLRRLGFPRVPRELIFPVGSMFWARSGVLNELFDMNWTWTDYPAEPLPYDGSLLHGLERVFGVLAAQRGRVVLTNVAGSSR